MYLFIIVCMYIRVFPSYYTMHSTTTHRYVEMSDASKAIIFGTILRSFLSGCDGGLDSMTDDIVTSSIKVCMYVCMYLIQHYYAIFCI
jgi:hypothetical protein